MDLNGCIEYLSKYCGLRYHIYSNERLRDFPTSVRLNCTWQGEDYSSWGVSLDQDLAYFKALVELIERISTGTFSSLYFKKSGLFKKKLSLHDISSMNNIATRLLHPSNSNGSACHFSYRDASKAACNELLERHTILSAFLLKIPPTKVSAFSSYEIPSEYSHSQYFWFVDKSYIVVSAVRITGGGFIFGHSCSTNLHEAKQKASDEVATNIIYVANTTNDTRNADKVITNEISSFNHYWRFSGDDRAFDFLEGRQTSTEKTLKDIPKLGDVFFAEIPIPSELKAFTKRLVCVRAISPNAQQLFFDNWEHHHINQRALTGYELPSFPHIIA